MAKRKAVATPLLDGRALGELREKHPEMMLMIRQPCGFVFQGYDAAAAGNVLKRPTVLVGDKKSGTTTLVVPEAEQERCLASLTAAGFRVAIIDAVKPSIEQQVATLEAAERAAEKPETPDTDRGVYNSRELSALVAHDAKAVGAGACAKVSLPQTEDEALRKAFYSLAGFEGQAHDDATLLLSVGNQWLAPGGSFHPDMLSFWCSVRDDVPHVWLYRGDENRHPESRLKPPTLSGEKLLDRLRQVFKIKRPPYRARKPRPGAVSETDLAQEDAALKKAQEDSAADREKYLDGLDRVAKQDAAAVQAEALHTPDIEWEAPLDTAKQALDRNEEPGLPDRDRALISALCKHKEGTEDHWEELRASGATDDQVLARIGGCWGTFAGGGTEGLHWDACGGRKAWWHFGRKQSGEKPTLAGKALVAEVRRVLGIPEPIEAPPPAKPAPAADAPFMVCYLGERTREKKEHYLQAESPEYVRRRKQIALYEKRLAKGDAEPRWGEWAEFDVKLMDGRRVSVQARPEDDGDSETATLEFFGPMSDSGFSSHYIPPEKYEGCTVSGLADYAEVLARQLFRGRKKSDDAPAAKPKPARPVSQVEEMKKVEDEANREYQRLAEEKAASVVKREMRGTKEDRKFCEALYRWEGLEWESAKGEEQFLASLSRRPWDGFEWGVYAAFLIEQASNWHRKRGFAVQRMQGAWKVPSFWKTLAISQGKGYYHLDRNYCACLATIGVGWASNTHQIFRATAADKIDAAERVVALKEDKADVKLEPWPIESIFARAKDAHRVRVKETGVRLRTNGGDPLVKLYADDGAGNGWTFLSTVPEWNLLMRRVGDKPGSMFPSETYFLPGTDQCGPMLFWAAGGTTDWVAATMLVENGLTQQDWDLDYLKPFDPAAIHGRSR